MRLLAIAITFAALLSPALAASGISIGAPGVGGTGCPAGTARASLSADGTSLSVRFDAYRVAAGGARSFDRKACGLSIPISVPAGKSVAIVSVDFQGVNRLPAGAKAVFRAEYFLAGGKGPVFEKTFNGPANGRFATSNTGTIAWSACGSDVVLRTNSSLRVQTTGGKAASSSVRSVDVNTAFLYHLRWKNC